MKLPFEFAPKLIFRLAIPGILLSVLSWPFLGALMRAFGLTVPATIAFPIAVVLFGWSMLLLDMPIYMLAEGRRFWPAWIRRWCVAAEQRRLAKHLTGRIHAEARGDRRAFAEHDVEIRTFPCDRDGLPVVLFPTRLGNLLTSFEIYPDQKYGLDGVFTWYRLWLAADKESRAELDDQQAIADSGLYVAIGLFAAGPICLLYAMAGSLSDAAMRSLPGAEVLLAAAVIAPAIGYVLYRLSLFAQQQYGELFRAFFDQYVGRLDFDKMVDELAAFMGDPAPLRSTDRNRAAVRFLKWHRYRRPGAKVNDLVTGW